MSSRAAAPEPPETPIAGAESTRRARTLLASGVAVTALGIAIAGTWNRDAGGIILAVGWAVLVYAIHVVGRLGASREPAPDAR